MNLLQTNNKKRELLNINFSSLGNFTHPNQSKFDASCQDMQDLDSFAKHGLSYQDLGRTNILGTS